MSNGGFNRPQKKRYFRRGIAVGLLAISLLMLLADKQQTKLLESGRLSFDDPSAKIMGVMASPLRGIELIFSSIGDRSTAYSKNQELTAEVERLREIEHRVLDMELKLKIYENLMEIDNGADDQIAKTVARTVNEKHGPFAHSALINAGRDKQVQLGHAVATSDGLIGHIVRVGRSSARVLLLNDLNSQISVMSQRSQSRAIMIGTNSDKPRLDYISRQGDWLSGDRVVTSGDDGILPSGIKIGTVETLETQQLVVNLFTDGKPIDWVWVYLFEPVAAPDETGEEEVIENETPDIAATPAEVDGLQ